METVEVLIRIPKEDLDFIKDEFADGDMPDEKDLKETTYFAIAKGKVLPKAHGALKDYDAIKSEYIRKMSVFMSEEERMDLLCTIVDEAEVVIEADKDGE